VVAAFVELAAEVSRRVGKTIAYRDLPPEQYKALPNRRWCTGTLRGPAADAVAATLER